MIIRLFLMRKATTVRRAIMDRDSDRAPMSGDGSQDCWAQRERLGQDWLGRVSAGELGDGHSTGLRIAFFRTGRSLTAWDLTTMAGMAAGIGMAAGSMGVGCGLTIRRTGWGCRTRMDLFRRAIEAGISEGVPALGVRRAGVPGVPVSRVPGVRVLTAGAGLGSILRLRGDTGQVSLGVMAGLVITIGATPAGT